MHRHTAAALVILSGIWTTDTWTSRTWTTDTATPSTSSAAAHPASNTSPAAPPVAHVDPRLACVRDRVVVIGHRGIGPGTRSLYGTARSEDTVPAFKAAMRAGADGFETDFWPTADSAVVSHHDATLARMTNGTGEIRRRSSGYVAAVRNVSGAPVPTFHGVLKQLRSTRPHVQQEFKDGWLFSSRVLRRLARLDRDLVPDVSKSVLWTTSQRSTLRRFHRLVPDIPIGLIDRSHGRPRLSTIPSWVDVILIEFGAADAAYIRRATARGHQVSLREVNDAQRMRQAVRMGAARVVTDRPEVLGRAC
jgi:glycerophosphoryl diester phosphodiesterase